MMQFTMIIALYGNHFVATVYRSTITTDCKHRAIIMLLIQVEVSVKVAYRSTTTTDCSHRAITMLLILAKVSVKVACWSTTTTDCKHSAITMLLFLVEVSVKAACLSVLQSPPECMLLILVEVYNNHRLQAQGYHHACYLFRWKYR